MENGLADLMLLEPEIDKFIQIYVDSFVKWEIVQFFHEHPQAEFKLSELAETVNRPPRQLRRELEELTVKKLIREMKNAKVSTWIYNLSPSRAEEKSLKEVFDRFISLCRTREGRLRVIYKILKDGKPVSGTF